MISEVQYGREPVLPRVLDRERSWVQRFQYGRKSVLSRVL